ncbi:MULTISPECIES: orotidine-5'-phosphate decarboxylase [Bacillaceae]|uniref:Orotidine 5'-phosphate decarboxylase n=1 Tax=Evansella alkalicola TaxID=745819 RepID=A0ABS6JPC1_9BACI|nr:MULTISPECIES: orotidine-5'-phosphate decarboxylase [Bacillaceae]MBU9720413.1 orotidine-5'-phosphate decarboxylase [Bacillus alkalicola]
MQQQPLIIALDFPTKEEALHFLEQFKGESLFVKVGMELFYREGAPLIKTLKEMGHEIFLDLKLHDIPTTVKRAMKQLAALEVDLVNVHAMGGIEMMKAAIEGLKEGAKSPEKVPMCIAVTQLTSMSEEEMKKELNIQSTLKDSVLHLCHSVREAGLDGVVCSAQEVPAIRENIGDDFYTVTPGIRRETDAVNDQHRVVTPGMAAEMGSSAIVVGRGITRANDPIEAYLQYKREWSV